MGNTGYDEGRGIVSDASGNIYTTGYFSGTVDFDPGAGTVNLISAGLYDIYVAKYNASGAYQWAFNAGSTAKDIGFGIDIDTSNNIYISGYFQGTADFDPGAGTANLTSGGVEDIFIAKYNSSGIYQWAINIGSTGIDQSLEISLDGSANILISGAFNGTVDFDPGAGTVNLSSAGLDDIFVAKYNSSGMYQWAFKIGSTGADIGYGVNADVSGNVYVTGGFLGTADFDPGAGVVNLTSAGAEDIIVAKYNSSGIYQWAINIGSTSSDVGDDVAADSAGNVYVTGEFQGTADFDPGVGIANHTSAGAEDIFLVKYNSAGVYQWAFKIGGTGIDYGNSIAFDPNLSGNVYFTGYFAGTSDFDPGTGTANLTSSGTQDIFVAKFNSSGTYQWAFKTGNTGGDIGRELTLDGSGNIHITGYFESTVDFDPNAGIANLTSAGLFDIFVGKYNEPLPFPLPFISGFESCDSVFSYEGVQLPLNSTTTPRTGTNHGQINGGCAGATAGCYDGSIMSPLLSFKPGCTYTVKIYARIAVAVGNLTIAKAVTATNASMKAATGADIILASTSVSDFTYKLFTSTFTVSNAESKYIGFQMYRAGGGGTAGAQMMLDDIVITKNDCGHCSNGIKDVDETSVDCGGTDCASAAPVAGTITPLAQLLACGSGNFSLSLCGQTGNIQWQFSQDDAAWYDISGENSTVLKGTVTDTTYFRAKVTNDGCTPTPVYSTSYININGLTANTWLTTGTTDWATATNWSAGAVPTSCHHVTIPPGGIQPIASAAASCNNLTIQTGATLTKNGAGGVDIYGDLINNGTFDYSASTASPQLRGGLNFIGGSGIFTAGAIYIRCMANSNYHLSSNVTVAQFDIQADASLSLQTFNLICATDFTQTGNFYANSGTLEIRSGATFTITNTNWGTGTLFLNVNGNNSLVILDDYYNIKIANTIANTTSIGANITASNNFIIDNATTTVSAGIFTITVGGTFTNNGTFTASTSTVVLNGSPAQFIQGLSATTFNNLTINNTSSTGVTLNTPANISGNLTLTKGKIFSTTTNILTINSGATVTAGTATSFVSGPLKYITATGVTFPIGKGNIWRRLTISAPATSSEFIGEFFNAGFGNYTVTAPLNNVSALEYWQLQRNSGTGNVTVKLYWEDATASEINDCLDLTIGRWNGTSWVEEAATATGTCSGAGTGNATTTAALSTFGNFTYGSKSSIVNPLGRSITTSAISPTAYCAGAAVSVPYTITGTYNPGNVFTAQLSDAAGSFAAPVNIGTLTSQVAGTISAELASSTPAGAGYRIRVISSNPIVTGTDNGANLSISVCSRYWVGNAGNWNDVLHWSTTSGGASGASIPHKGVYVYFDNLSFSGPAQVVTMPAGVWYMKSFIPSGVGQQTAIVGQGQMVVGQ